MSACQFISVYKFLTVYVNICISVCLSGCMSACLFVFCRYIPLYQSISLSAYLSICLSVVLSVRQNALQKLRTGTNQSPPSEFFIYQIRIPAFSFNLSPIFRHLKNQFKVRRVCNLVSNHDNFFVIFVMVVLLSYLIMRLFNIHQPTFTRI